jgi:hypothetical protein
MTDQLPLYQCHKTVRAVKIREVLRERRTFHHDGGNEHEHVYDEPRLTYEASPGRYFEIPVTVEYLAKHQPVAGGYYVRYEDGYESFSPAKAFEDGYSLLSDDRGQVDVLKALVMISEQTKRIEEAVTFDWAAFQKLRKASA